MRILITGGAGFVGSNLALRYKEENPDAEVIVLDNLKRRGSELALPRLRKSGIEFIHGDVRVRDDLFSVGEVDTIIDCSAEPSVLAGQEGSPDYVIQTNLVGTLNALELARKYSSGFIFLSTSRVYPVEPLNRLNLIETESRFELSDNQSQAGVSAKGIAESFPIEGARSLYGASKLASELFVKEYVDTFNIPAVINRCGVLTGPWQMGKVDQGVIVLWVAKHIFGGSLSYIGYGGQGKQVRDILHVEDLYELLSHQLTHLSIYRGEVFNVGGGRETSVSLRELTQLCQAATGKTIQVGSVTENRPNDLAIYITDNDKVKAHSSWAPKRSVADIIEDITRWITDNKNALEPILA